MGYMVGIDTGGTFTDIVILDEEGMITSAKSPTTPDALEQGLMNGLGRAAEQLRLGLEEFLSQIDMMRFSGTTATNALLTRIGEPAGMITTRGFEDTLFIGRAISAWAGLTEVELRRSFRQRKPEPLIPKSMVCGVPERIDWSGREVVPLDLAAVERAAVQLSEAGAESIAICFLWSVKNASHEEEAREVISQMYPAMRIHCSHDVAPSIGEYERFVTTAIDAYVSPVLARFLGDFQGILGDRGFRGQFLIAQADGGCLFPEDAQPVFTLHSGPAAGVMASQSEGERIGCPNVICTDVGGTSFDVGLVHEGNWIYSREPELGGYFLSVPMIEVASIGAGGGSIAWVDELGVLHVGPSSAGARPGPACYGHGGMRPTVTDADLLLGYLDPDNFLGGRMRLDRDAALAAINSVSERVGLDTIQTAAGIFEIANAHMGDLLTRQVVSRGHDPREFVVLAYGGAGPMHSAFYAAHSGAREVVVPARAGTFSALGVMTAPLIHTASEHVFARMPVDASTFNETFAGLAVRVDRALQDDGVAAGDRVISYVVEMRYGAQVHTVRLGIPARHFDFDAVEDVSRLFDLTYEQMYGAGSGYPEAGRYITSFIAEGVGRLREPQRRRAEVAGVGDVDARAQIGERKAFFDGAFVSTAIYDYERLQSGDEISGPAILEARETTVVVPNGCTATVDGYQNVRLTGVTQVPDVGVALSGLEGTLG